MNDRDQAFLAAAQTSILPLEGNQVKVYRWGKQESPKILLVHGWMGRATQFNVLVETLVDKGYQCITFDAPGHGQSSGKETNVLEFATIVELIYQQEGAFQMVIGHSMGAVATLFAMNKWPISTKIVQIGAPALGKDILSGYEQKVNARPQNQKYLHQFIYKKVGLDFFDVQGEKLIQTIPQNTAVLNIHDQHDTEVPFYHQQKFAEVYPQLLTMATENLGHNRTLRDERVVAKIMGFLTSEAKK